MYKNHICGIYKITNSVNGKLYIGQSIHCLFRMSSHKTHLRNGTHCNSHLQSAWNKYGEDNFVFEVIEECEKELLNSREKYYISLYNSNNENFGYNKTDGGGGILNISAESRKKKSESLKKHYREHPEIAKIRFEHAAEAQRTPEARARKSKEVLERYKNPEYRKKHKEIFQSEELKRRISEGNKRFNRVLSEEHVNAIKKSLSKPVICVETGRIYPSSREAMRQIGGNVNINKALHDKNKTSGGYHWKFIEEIAV